MAELTTIARPYAKAAFEFARHSNDLAGWANALSLLSAVAQSDGMNSVQNAPDLTAEQKSAAFIEVCGEELNAGQQNFVKTLAENKRLPLLPQVLELYELFKANQEKAIDVDVQTAFEISSDLQSKLAETLSKKLDREVTLQTSVDKSLLGGALIRAGDTVIDGSVRGRLAKLAEAMNA